MQSIFKRYENKYLITYAQHAALYNLLSRRMAPDYYGEYLVQNLYYDTENWDVIRASIESPLFKEKLRLRCYGDISQQSDLFLELKKKYDGVVHKRRIAIPADALSGGSVRGAVAKDTSQIAHELGFYLKSHAVSEKMYIVYRRAAFTGTSDAGLRVTIDSDVRFRLGSLDFSCPGYGHAILPQGKTLMEIKTFGGMPIWLARALCDNQIYPTSFSKYGICYTNYILKNAPPARKALICA